MPQRFSIQLRVGDLAGHSPFDPDWINASTLARPVISLSGKMCWCSVMLERPSPSPKYPIHLKKSRIKDLEITLSVQVPFEEVEFGPTFCRGPSPKSQGLSVRVHLDRRDILPPGAQMISFLAFGVAISETSVSSVIIQSKS